MSKAVLVAALAVTLCASLELLSSKERPRAARDGGRGRRALVARSPLAFEPNLGQADPSVRYLARVPHATLFLDDRGATIALAPKSGSQRSVAMRLIGAAPDARFETDEPLHGVVNHYVGSDPSKWRSAVPTYGAVTRRDAYPGVDVVFHGDAGMIEYDFIVAPGADTDQIAVAFDGAERASIEDGRVVLALPDGEIRQERPVAYQLVEGARRPVACEWTSRADGAFGFVVGAHDASRTLVIDPVIVYATYLGGLGADAADGIAVDSAGRAHVVGSTTSSDFPTANAFQNTRRGGQSAFVTKLDKDGTSVLYSTYFGGTNNPFGAAETFGKAIALDDADAAYVTGWTRSTDFPTTAGAFMETAPGARRDAQGVLFAVNSDAFVSKFDSMGALVWSTYLGGAGEQPDELNADDFATGVAADDSGNAYVTGQTLSTNFPTTSDAFQAVDPDAVRFNNAIFLNQFDVFFTKVAAGGRSVSFSTYVGGTLDDGGPGGRLTGGLGGIDLDPFGNVYLAGRTESDDFPVTITGFQRLHANGYDAFVFKLARLTGESGVTYAPAYSSYFGGVADEGSLVPSKFGVAARAMGRVVICGDTRSVDLPASAGAFQTALANGAGVDGFVAKFNTNASGAASREFATYLGGTADDLAAAVGVASSNSIQVVGRTGSLDFPKVDPLQQFLDGPTDAFAATLSPTGAALTFSTFLGGRGDDGASALALLAPDDMFLAGDTSSDDLPQTTGKFQPQFAGGATDAFVVKLSGEAEPSGHDLALLRILVPRRVTLNDRRPTRTVSVGVVIQNRSTHAETIADLAMLGGVVRLTVESLGACPAPVASMRSGPPAARRLPVTLRPGQKFTVFFDVTFDCANDPAKTTGRDPGHDDFTYRAQVRHEAIDGAADDHPIDDTCPRGPMNEPDPFPNGKLRVTGCPPVFTDVVDVRVP